jgi:hypothetical protein
MPMQPPMHQRRKAPRKGQQHQRNRQATRAMHTGSKGWRILRQMILERDLYCCRVCHGWGDQVDHIDGDASNNDPGNLQVLCLRDHSAKTMRELNARGRSDADR